MAQFSIKLWRNFQLVSTLHLYDDILLLAKEDTMGKALQNLSFKKRERASPKRVLSTY